MLKKNSAFTLFGKILGFSLRLYSEKAERSLKPPTAQTVSEQSPLTGFTLLELVIVIAILAILASMAITRFVDLRKKALDASESATADSIRGGILLEFSRRITSGISPAWPDDNPMNYLENPLPFQQYDSTQTPVSDNINWMVRSMPWSQTYWEIRCPHSSGAIGFTWYYCFKDCLLSGADGNTIFPAGTFISYKQLLRSINYQVGH